MNKKLLGFVIILLLSAQQIYPLTKTQVFTGAAIAAGLVSAGVYGVSFLSCLEFSSKKENNDNAIGHENWLASSESKIPLVSAGATFFISYPLFAWLASYYTAESRYNWAMETFKELDENRLYCVRVTDLNLDRVLQESGCESEDFPLVSAFYKLRSFDHTLVSISEELEKAIIDTDSSELRKKLGELLERVYIDLSRVRENEAVVKNHDKAAWFKQWKLYQKQKLVKEKMRLEREKMGQHYPVKPHAHVVYHYN